MAWGHAVVAASGRIWVSSCPQSSGALVWRSGEDREGAGGFGKALWLVGLRKPPALALSFQCLSVFNAASSCRQCKPSVQAL